MPVLDILTGTAFSGWQALNDRIMGGQSSGSCQVGPHGLLFEGMLIAEGGGFVSCRSPLFSPPLDLSAYEGLELEMDGEGRSFKLALASADALSGLTELIPGGLRWVMEFATPVERSSTVRIPFTSLRPSVRAKPVPLPRRFDSSRLSRIQLLHSRFGDDGAPNLGFRAGAIRFELKAIRAYG